MHVPVRHPPVLPGDTWSRAEAAGVPDICRQAWPSSGLQDRKRELAEVTWAKRFLRGGRRTPAGASAWSAGRVGTAAGRGPSPLQPTPPSWSLCTMACSLGEVTHMPGCSRLATQGQGSGALPRPQWLCVRWSDQQHVATRSGSVDKAARGMASLCLSTPRAQTRAPPACECCFCAPHARHRPLVPQGPPATTILSPGDVPGPLASRGFGFLRGKENAGVRLRRASRP